jgi:hydrogenase nickel incorporation protein HypB
VLRKNDVLARALRERFSHERFTVASFVSSPGSGKTALLEATIRALAPACVAALVGDLATDRDAQRLERAGARVRQITTGTVCHLDAEMIERALADWNVQPADYLFIENVGNLVCPASYDLGERLRAVLISVTEGEDKPLKYPTIFHTADVALVTKIDLVDAVGADRELLRRNIDEVRPGMEVFEVSARSGEGMPAWIGRLEALRRST